MRRLWDDFSEVVESSSRVGFAEPQGMNSNIGRNSTALIFEKRVEMLDESHQDFRKVSPSKPD